MVLEAATFWDRFRFLKHVLNIICAEAFQGWLWVELDNAASASWLLRSRRVSHKAMAAVSQRGCLHRNICGCLWRVEQNDSISILRRRRKGWGLNKAGDGCSREVHLEWPVDSDSTCPVISTCEGGLILAYLKIGSTQYILFLFVVHVEILFFIPHLREKNKFAVKRSLCQIGYHVNSSTISPTHLFFVLRKLLNV